MPYTITVLSSSLTNANYSQINELVGQMKDKILECPLATLISDSVGTTSTGRILKFTVGTSPHPLWVSATGYTAVSFYIYNIAGTSGLTSIAYPTTVQNSTFKVMWGQNNFVLQGGTGATFSCLGGYALASDSSWLAYCYYSSVHRWYVPGDNNYRSMIQVTYPIDTEGKYTVEPIRLSIAKDGATATENNIHDVYPVAVYAFTVYAGKILQDALGNYYYCPPSGSTIWPLT